jgi:hypothetical protein
MRAQEDAVARLTHEESDRLERKIATRAARIEKSFDILHDLLLAIYVDAGRIDHIGRQYDWTSLMDRRCEAFQSLASEIEGVREVLDKIVKDFGLAR